MFWFVGSRGTWKAPSVLSRDEGVIIEIPAWPTNYNGHTATLFRTPSTIIFFLVFYDSEKLRGKMHQQHSLGSCIKIYKIDFQKTQGLVTHHRSAQKLLWCLIDQLGIAHTHSGYFVLKRQISDPGSHNPEVCSKTLWQVKAKGPGLSLRSHLQCFCVFQFVYISWNAKQRKRELTTVPCNGPLWAHLAASLRGEYQRELTVAVAGGEVYQRRDTVT